MNYNEFNNTYPNELYNQLQPITMTLISIYNSYYNQIQLLQQLFTIGLTINYNSIVKESSVLGLSTEADGLLTKVQATTCNPLSE
jgi:hypothetical protein